MPNSYTVQQGDTLTTIAIIFFGDGREYREILQANPSISDPNNLKVGQVLTIPDLPPNEPTEPTEIDVTPETIINGVSEEVAIVIDGTPFKYWTNASITRSFDTLADSFSLSAPWFPDKEEYRRRFKPFQYAPAVIYVGGARVVTGNIITIKTNTAANSRVLTIEGYSRNGIIADVPSSATSWPVNIDGLNLKEIAEKLTKPFAVKVVFESDPGPAFSGNDKQGLEPEEKIGSFLIRLAKQRGLVIGSNEKGQMVFRQTTQDAAVASIFEGKLPYISSDATFNGQERYSDVTALSTETKKGSGKIFTVEDPELKNNSINRPYTFKASDTNPGGLEKAATAKLGRQIANSVSINVNVRGFHRPDKFLWKDNEIVVYQSFGDMIYIETEFLIRNVKYNKKPDGTDSNLGLVFPEAYSGEIRTEYPWDL